MQKEIIAAIAAYLEGKTILTERWDSKMVETKINWPIPVSELSTEIAAAVAPLVEAPYNAHLKDYFDNLPKEISREPQDDNLPF